jgi:predicted nucleic acid-binding protein
MQPRRDAAGISDRMMILFDTSVWIRHFRAPEKNLIAALENGTVLTHESVIGELVVGRIPNAASTLKDLLRLPFAPAIPFKELLDLIGAHRLTGKGLSWIDIHLLGSALAADAELITYDVALATAWKKMH